MSFVTQVVPSAPETLEGVPTIERPFTKVIDLDGTGAYLNTPLDNSGATPVDGYISNLSYQGAQTFYPKCNGGFYRTIRECATCMVRDAYENRGTRSPIYMRYGGDRVPSAGGGWPQCYGYDGLAVGVTQPVPWDPLPDQNYDADNPAYSNITLKLDVKALYESDFSELEWIKTVYKNQCLTPYKSEECFKDPVTGLKKGYCTGLGLNDTAGVGSLCRQWYNTLDNDTGPVNKTNVVEEVCSQYKSLGLAECACQNREDDEIFKQLSEGYLGTVSPLCWYKPCAAAGNDRLFTPVEKEARANCNSNFCGNFFIQIDSDNNEFLEELNQYVSCDNNTVSGNNTGGGGGGSGGGGSGGSNGGGGSTGEESNNTLLIAITVIGAILVLAFFGAAFYFYKQSTTTKKS